MGGSWLPLCSGIGYLAHEEDAPGAVLHNEDQEGSVELHGGWHRCKYYLYGGSSSCVCSLLINFEDGLMEDLRGINPLHAPWNGRERATLQLQETFALYFCA